MRKKRLREIIAQEGTTNPHTGEIVTGGDVLDQIARLVRPRKKRVGR